MDNQDREQLVEMVEQSNEVVISDVQYENDQHIVTPELNLSEIVVAHVKSQCPECGKYLSNVNEHMKLVHYKIKDHHCSSCNYRACFKNDLEKHMRSIHGIKSVEPTVIIAMKSEGVEPFEELVDTTKSTNNKLRTCPYCSKLLSNTKEHIKAVHLKEKNYFCDSCDYKTLFKSDLVKHNQLVHMKIKKSCPECGKQVANLHEHIRLVHKREKKFKCNFCGYTCAKQSDMKKHTKNVHKINPSEPPNIPEIQQVH